MPAGIYIRTEEHKRKIGLASKGRKHSEETKRKIGKASMGKPCSDETKRKISEAKRGERNSFYGKSHTEEARRKMSGANSPRWKGGKIKILCMVCGKERYVNPSKVRYGWGKFCSRRCGGIFNHNRNKKHDTDIERLIENELIRRNIPYTKQVWLLGISVVDFLLPHDIVIYADGDFWHSLPKAKQKDIDQEFILTFYGYKVFRFTGSDIQKSPRKCIDKIKWGSK